MAEEIEIDLLPVQMDFMESTSDITMLICGRGFGKTFIASMKAAVLLTEGHSIIAMAQNFRAVKHALFPSIIKALDALHQTYEVNISDFTIKVGKATCYGFSSQNYESCRGLDSIKALLIDEACLAPRQAFDVASACLRGAGKPEIYLISTPRGASNWVTKLKNNENVTYLTATSHDNTFLDKGFVKLLESQYTDEFYKQEILGEVLSNDAPNQMIKTALLSNVQIVLPDEANWKYVIGIDPARFGQDSTVICVRKGKNIVAHESLGKSDSDDIANLVLKYVVKYGKDNISEINFDGTGGFSNGAFDILKKRFDNVHEINFSGKSPDDNLKNMRTYLYQLAIKYFTDGGCVGYYPELIEELEAQEYLIGTDGKKGLVPKLNVKQKIGKSPDNSDAFVLTLLTKGDMFTNGLLIKSLQEGQRRLLFKAISDSAGWVS